jgi:EAL and modified HD-GYP domain-containing signal transduction protein
VLQCYYISSVYGYELLFRGEKQSSKYDGTSSLQSTATIVSGLFESGIDDLVEDKVAFVNFDGDFIFSELLELIDSTRMVVEVLEDVEVNQSLIDRLTELKYKGYKIALDDFVESYSEYPLVPLADIIKFDLMATPLDTLKEDVQKAVEHKKIVLAEKVESEEEFNTAKEMGFHLFQGYFFSKPNVVGKSNDKTTNKIQYGRLISELSKLEPSYQVLAEIIEKDAQLAYRLMRVVSNRSQDDLIYSIKKALTYMGLKELNRWVNILMIRDLGSNKPKELMRLSLVRAKFAERIALKSTFKKMKYEASMMGLFSTLDAILDETMEEALSDVALPIAIKRVLIHQEGEMLPIYNLIKAYETGNWDEGESCAKALGIREDILCEEYKNALKWSKEVMDMMN